MSIKHKFFIQVVKLGS